MSSTFSYELLEEGKEYVTLVESRVPLLGTVLDRLTIEDRD